MNKFTKTKNYNGCDQYLITKDDQTTSLVWQTGEESEVGVNGLQLIDVIVALMERVAELDPNLDESVNENTMFGLMIAMYFQAQQDGEIEEIKKRVKIEDPINTEFQRIIRGVYGYKED